MNPHWTNKIDIWSLGCIFTELSFLLIPQNQMNQCKYLFPGSSCNPMSPYIEEGQDKTPQNVVHINDQLIKILEFSGPLSLNQLSFIKDKEIMQYVCNLQTQVSYKQVLQQIRHINNPKIIQLLLEMLQFNPEKRLSASELLKNSLFDDIRVPELE